MKYTMKVMRIVVPSTASYAIQHLSREAGVEIDDRQVVDVPLRTDEQVAAVKELQNRFQFEGLSRELRNGPNAVTVYSCDIIDT